MSDNTVRSLMVRPTTSEGARCLRDAQRNTCMPTGDARLRRAPTVCTSTHVYMYFVFVCVYARVFACVSAPKIAVGIVARTTPDLFLECTIMSRMRFCTTTKTSSP